MKINATKPNVECTMRILEKQQHAHHQHTCKIRDSRRIPDPQHTASGVDSVEVMIHLDGYECGLVNEFYGSTGSPRTTGSIWSDQSGGLKIYISLHFYIQGKADRTTDNGNLSCGGNLTHQSRFGISISKIFNFTVTIGGFRRKQKPQYAHQHICTCKICFFIYTSSWPWSRPCRRIRTCTRKWIWIPWSIYLIKWIQ